MKREKLQTKGFDTQTIHGGRIVDQFGSLTMPIYQTSTFIFENAEQGGRRFALEEDGYIYSRLGNPTTASLEEKMAILEKSEAAVVFSSGMGAISSSIWCNLKQGDHVIAPLAFYGCSFAYIQHGLTEFGIEVDLVDTRYPENVKKCDEV